MTDLELLLPADWAIIPAAPDARIATDLVISDIIAAALPASLPRDSAEPWRHELRRRLTEAVSEARARGARSVILPVGGIGGALVPGSILISVLDDVGTDDSEALLNSMLLEAGDDGMFLEIGGNPALRVVQILPASDQRGTSTPSVQVTYYLPHPEQRSVWGLLTATVISDGDPGSDVTSAYVLLFDAIASTARWTAEAGPTAAEFVAAVTAGRAAS